MTKEKASFFDELQQIPCLKKTFTFSTCSGIGAGLATFIFTSRIKRSSDIAVATFCLTTLVHWIHCRYKWTSNYFLSQKMKKSYHDVMLNEGRIKSPDSPKQGVTEV